MLGKECGKQRDHKRTSKSQYGEQRESRPAGAERVFRASCGDVLGGEPHHYSGNTRGGQCEYRGVQSVRGGEVAHAGSAENVREWYFEYCADDLCDSHGSEQYRGVFHIFLVHRSSFRCIRRVLVNCICDTA